MIGLEILISGARELADRFARARGAYNAAIARSLAQASEVMTSEVKHQLSIGPKDIASTGSRIETYRYPPNTTEHLRVRTGRLRQSIGYRVTRSPSTWQSAESLIGPQRVPYARIHEFGGRAGRGGAAYIRPRPYLEPAVRATADHVARIMGDGFVAAVESL